MLLALTAETRLVKEAALDLSTTVVRVREGLAPNVIPWHFEHSDFETICKPKFI